MKYHEINPIKRGEAQKIFDSSELDRFPETLLSIAFYEPDWEWVEEICLNYIEAKEKNIKRTAIACLGHLARIHKILNLEKVIPALEALKGDKEFIGYAEDALSDIDMFINKS
jgi:hypothetical protein